MRFHFAVDRIVCDCEVRAQGLSAGEADHDASVPVLVLVLVPVLVPVQVLVLVQVPVQVPVLILVPVLVPVLILVPVLVPVLVACNLGLKVYMVTSPCVEEHVANHKHEHLQRETRSTSHRDRARSRLAHRTDLRKIQIVDPCVQ